MRKVIGIAVAIVAVAVGGTACSASHAPAKVAVRPMTSVAASAVADVKFATMPIPCTTTAHDYHTINETCGPCQVIEFPGAAVEQRVIDALDSGVTGEYRDVWLDVGNLWIANDGNVTYAGAVRCAGLLGGFVQHYSSGG